MRRVNELYVYTDNIETNCSALASCVSACFLSEVQDSGFYVTSHNAHHCNTFPKEILKIGDKLLAKPHFVSHAILLSTICFLNKMLHCFCEDVLNLATVGGGS